jgi:iron complex outermembrane receptor protein
MTRTSSRAILLCGAALAGLSLPAGGAYAQAAQAADNNVLQEVIVHAQKREQNLQDVPVAVSAVSQETLQANRVVSVMDLTGLAPGLLARANAGSLGSPSYSMRGIFASASTPASDREVSTYLDGVYIGSVRGATFDLPDISGIEVLRGPQGTLFGRNATAGAVSITTRDPTGDFHVRQELTGGNEGVFRSRTSIDFPSWGPISAYVTYVNDQQRGDVRNLGAGTTFDRSSPFTNIGVTSSPKWLGGHNNNNVFAAIKYKPMDNLSVIYKFDWEYSHLTPEARDATVLNPNNLEGNLLLQVLAAQPTGGGAFGPVVLDPSGKRPNAVNNAWTQAGYQNTLGHNITIQWRPTDNITIKNIAAYRFSTAYGPSTIMGVDGLQFTAGSVTPYATFAAYASVPGFANYPSVVQQAIIGNIANALKPAEGMYFAGYEGNSWSSAWQASDEVQANYESKFLTLTVGALYYHSQEVDSGLPGMNPNPAFGAVPFQLPLGNVQIGTAHTTSIAGYAQAEFHLTQQLDLIAGGRVTSDKKTGDFITGGTYASGAITGTSNFPWTFSKTKPTFSVDVNYKPVSGVLGYVKYSTAFLSGGAVGPLSFSPETVASWEAGLKTEWFERRLRVNLALWQADYDNLQSAQSGTNAGEPAIAVVVVDNGTLKANGVELDIAAKPIDGLTLNGSVGYTRGKLVDPSQEVAQGEPYLWSQDPKWIASMSAEYVTRPLFQDAYAAFRMDANYTGSYRALPDPLTKFENPVFAPYEFNPETWIINGRVSLRDIKMQGVKTEVALWVKNLLDNKNPTYPLLFGTIEHNESWQPARTFGIDVDFDF